MNWALGTRSHQAYIDAPFALHPIIIQGIERKRIFEDDKNREDFLEHLSGLAEETISAWNRQTDSQGIRPSGTGKKSSLKQRPLTSTSPQICQTDYHDFNFSINTGINALRSAKTITSAISLMGASRSRLIATMNSDFFIPARC